MSIKIVKCLVAVNEEGKFFALQENGRSTSPYLVTHPYNAKHVFPLAENDYENPKEATYYFEDSKRMKEWLQGFKMVCVMLIIDYVIMEKY